MSFECILKKRTKHATIYTPLLKQCVTEHDNVFVPVHIQENHWLLLYFEKTNLSIHVVEPYAVHKTSNDSTYLQQYLHEHFVDWNIQVCATGIQPSDDQNNCGVVICTLSRIYMQGMFRNSFIHLYFFNQINSSTWKLDLWTLLKKEDFWLLVYILLRPGDSMVFVKFTYNGIFLYCYHSI